MTPYQVLRPALFRLPPEGVHRLATLALDTALATSRARAAARARLMVSGAALEVEAFGVRMANPVGLAAGFDKGAEHVNALGALGFGFVEVGTVTALPQPGNPRPRLRRLAAREALVNHMGFNNPGAEAVAERLAATRVEPVLAINIGKSKVTPLARAADDHLRSVALLAPWARWFVVNVSSPNTPGLRDLQAAGPLRELLDAVVGATRVPVLVKLAPDLADAAVEEAVGIAAEAGAAGVVATNTTIAHPYGSGGLSGRPLHARALEVVALASQVLPVVGAGGVFDAEGAWRMLQAGATLVQLYTGFVFGGPTVARDVNRGLLERVRREGLASVAAARARAAPAG